MADSLGKNPIVIDLNTATDRIVKTGDVFVRGILISGTDGGAAPVLTLSEANASGAVQFRYEGSGTSTLRQVFYDVSARLKSPFFNNIEGTAWAAGSVMLIYLD